jgi:hypothetical protein
MINHEKFYFINFGPQNFEKKIVFHVFFKTFLIRFWVLIFFFIFDRH